MSHGAPGQRPGARTTETWVTLLRALVALALGVAVLVTGRDRATLANFIATYWLLGSVLTLRWVLAHRRRPGSRPAFAAALVGIAAGAVALARVLIRDVVSPDTLLDLLGVAAVLTGLLRLTGAFHDDPVVDDRPRLRFRVVLGILEIALGAVLILAHAPTRPTALALGLWGLVAGTILLRDALALRPVHPPSG